MPWARGLKSITDQHLKLCQWKGGLLGLDTCWSLCLVLPPSSLLLRKLLLICQASVPAQLFQRAGLKSTSLGIIRPVRQPA